MKATWANAETEETANNKYNQRVTVTRNNNKELVVQQCAVDKVKQSVRLIGKKITNSVSSLEKFSTPGCF